ncbi:unnamed protein product [Strongylus vulgaris]|uniref:Uncharacterized protein n=1 Tax=Strongylus vulgaris TaxID=40348 RepID=A0A3P7HXE1_STRVU|nr:unnamed protein product [Strongylus vulgaris]
MSSYNSSTATRDVLGKAEPGLSNCEEKIVYDALQVEEMGHYEIVGEDGNFVIDDTAFASNSKNSPPRVIKRGGRIAQASPGTILRRQPYRESRVKSFKQLLDYSNKTDAETSGSNPFVEAAPARVFVSNDVDGMHLDWPLYSQQAESFATAAHIIVSEAALVQSSLICVTVPQEFTEVGTFVISMSGLEDRHEVTRDGLGSWGSPQGTTKFYNFCHSTRKLTTGTPDAYTYKVQCNRYIHPGTDERGNFIRKIYCGMASTGEGCSFAVITYSWEGTPHPISITVPSSLSTKQRPYGARSWEVICFLDIICEVLSKIMVLITFSLYGIP